jgi:hypothetical protein
VRPIDDHYSYGYLREQYRRERALADFQRHMEAVVEARPEWYVWVTEGQPILTGEQYERVLTPRKPKRQSNP